MLHVHIGLVGVGQREQAKLEERTERNMRQRIEISGQVDGADEPHAHRPLAVFLVLLAVLVFVWFFQVLRVAGGRLMATYPFSIANISIFISILSVQY